MKKRLSSEEQQKFRYLILMLSAAVNGAQPVFPPGKLDWGSLIKLSQLCGVQAMLADSALRLPDGAITDAEARKTLRSIRDFELFIDSVLSYEAERLLAEFDACNIKNMPVKGYFLKKEYPRSDFRSVSDFDILFDPKQTEDVKAAFERLGYSFEFKDDNQYHFTKKPAVYIEMHESLVHSCEPSYPYLKDALGRGSLREGFRSSYEMSFSDHYIYMLIHSSNHFRIGGMGIRMVLDQYIYYKNHRMELDFDYINEKLETLGLVKFERKIRELSFQWFASDKPTVTFDDFETYICLSKRLGRASVHSMLESYKATSGASGKKKSKFGFLMSKIFPPVSRMKLKYPYVEKYPILLPATWTAMWASRVFSSKKIHVKSGIKSRVGYSKDDVEYIKGIFSQVEFKDLDIRK